MTSLYLLIVCTTLLCGIHGQRLLLAGGGVEDNNYEIWDKVVEMAGGASARIGVVTAASSTPVDSWNFYGPLFLARGAAETYWIPVHMANQSAAEDPEVVANIQRMTGFFFGGGDQARIIATFYRDFREETAALAAMRDRYNQSTAHLMAGTSAGTVAMCTGPMIRGGYSWESLIFGAYDFRDVPIPQYTVTYDQDGGLGFLDKFLLDSHFSERGREGRFLRLIADTFSIPLGTPYGIGIDENTAVLIYDANKPTAYAEIIGENGAVFIDVTESTVDEQAPIYPRFTDFIFHYITPGDVVNLEDLTITFGPGKVNIIGNEELTRAPTTNDVFLGEKVVGDVPEFTGCATGLFNTATEQTSASTTTETSPEYTVNFLQTDPRQVAYKDTTTGVISYSYLMIGALETPGSA